MRKKMAVHKGKKGMNPPLPNLHPMGTTPTTKKKKTAKKKY